MAHSNETTAEKYERMCFTKNRYPSKEDADRAARNSTRTYRERYSAYLCPFCHTWHIGHNPKKVKYVDEHRHEAYMKEMRHRRWKREEERRKRPKKGQKKHVQTGMDDQSGSDQEE